MLPANPCCTRAGHRNLKGTSGQEKLWERAPDEADSGEVGIAAEQDSIGDGHPRDAIALESVALENEHSGNADIEDEEGEEEARSHR